MMKKKTKRMLLESAPVFVLAVIIFLIAPSIIHILGAGEVVSVALGFFFGGIVIGLMLEKLKLVILIAFASVFVAMVISFYMHDLNIISEGFVRNYVANISAALIPAAILNLMKKTVGK